MLGSEDKGTKLSGFHSVSSSPWSLLCCRSGFSSTAENEPNNEKHASKNSSEISSATTMKPGGWKAMPFILGLNVL